MKHKPITGLLLVTILVLPLASFAQGPHRAGVGPQPERGGPSPRDRGPGYSLMRLERLKEAGATEAQIEAIKQLHFDAQGKEIDLRAQVQKAELALRELMLSDSPTETAVMKAADEVAQARANVFKHELGTRLKAREILGPDLLGKLRPLGRGDERGPRREAPELEERD